MLDIGPFALQPSEFAKSCIIIFMAVSYSRLEKMKVKNIYLFIFPVVISLIIALLIAMQPDLGTALIIGGITIFIFMSIPYVKKNIIKVLQLLMFWYRISMVKSDQICNDVKSKGGFICQ